MRNRKLELEVRIANLRSRHGRDNANIIRKLERKMRTYGE